MSVRDNEILIKVGNTRKYSVTLRMGFASFLMPK